MEPHPASLTLALEEADVYYAKQDGETEGSTAIGKFLMNTLALAPKVSASDVERMFNTHIQDVLLISYLANTIRTQIDLSNKLANLTASTGIIAVPTAATATAGGK